MTDEQKIHVVLFAGGRGAASITQAIANHPQIDYSILVNAYDDGLSTGRLRDWIPGMLGPSDIRKNCITVMPVDNPSQQALQRLLEYRFPDPASGEEVLEQLLSIVEWNFDRIPNVFLREALFNITYSTLHDLNSWLNCFLNDHKNRRQQLNRNFDFSDCAFGNLVFSGCYLACGHDFNSTVDKFMKLCSCRTTVLNLTDGSEGHLSGLKSDGEILWRESQLVDTQSGKEILDIFLTERPLSTLLDSHHLPVGLSERRSLMDTFQYYPKINPVAAQKIRSADIIIYGPGTQFSSLFPSYLTWGLAEEIAANKHAEKIFIGNLMMDHDIQSETVNSLILKFQYFITRKSTVPKLPADFVTTYFIQSENIDQPGRLRFRLEGPLDSSSQLHVADWQDEAGKHLGGQIVNELLGIVQDRFEAKLKTYSYMVSILVPGLNEQQTLKRCLEELKIVDFHTLGLSREIIYIDGGSSDDSFSIAESIPGIRCFKLEGPQRGKGRCLLLGLEKSRGNIVAFFPCDGEYRPETLLQLIRPICSGEAPAVIGSRAIKCVNLNRRIHEIYASDPVGFLVSKYGGMLLSVMCLLLYNRYISDPLSSVKVFDRQAIRKLPLSATGFDLDMEILAMLSMEEAYILELPVEYMPRNRKAGKKMSIYEGLRCIRTLFTSYFNHRRNA